ncbi:hypothetical protein TUM4249_06290 [Shewanella sp. KT0246]|nr:hypothetical protein TUM4249_06290 [Shewanella sp. KT0246]
MQFFTRQAVDELVLYQLKTKWYWTIGANKKAQLHRAFLWLKQDVLDRGLARTSRSAGHS